HHQTDDPIHRDVRVIAIADHPFEGGQPDPRSTCCLAAFPLAACIPDRSGQCAIPLALNDGGKLIVGLWRVAIESAEPVRELVSLARAPIGKAIEIELRSPSILQGGNDTRLGVTKNESNVFRPLR